MNRPSAAQSWVLALWSGYIATWAAVSGSGAVVVVAWWLAGIVLVQAIAQSMARPAATDDGSYVPEPSLDAGPASNR